MRPLIEITEAKVTVAHHKGSTVRFKQMRFIPVREVKP